MVPAAGGERAGQDGIPNPALSHASALTSTLPWNAPGSSMWESGVSRDLGCVSSHLSKQEEPWQAFSPEHPRP